jgi:hypothetical protein
MLMRPPISKRRSKSLHDTRMQNVDRGLLERAADDLHWSRSRDGWSDVLEKLRSLAAATRPGHHYLDGPSDDLQVIASAAEYGEEWWNTPQP